MTSCRRGRPRARRGAPCGRELPASTISFRRAAHEVAHPGHQVVDLTAQRLGVGWEFGGEDPAAPGQRGARRLGAQGGRSAQELAQRQGPTEMDVGVVLPGEAHAAQDLDATLGRLHVGVEGHRPGQDGRGGRPGRHRRCRPPGRGPRPGPWSARPRRRRCRPPALMAWNHVDGRPNWRWSWRSRWPSPGTSGPAGALGRADGQARSGPAGW